MVADSVIAELKKIVGDANVSTDAKDKAKMLKPGKEVPGLVLTAPETHEQVQEIVKWRRRIRRR